MQRTPIVRTVRPVSEHGFYDDASIYDILHAPGTADEVDGLTRIALRFAPGRADEQVWLEPACGTGRYLRLAAARGRHVIGFDRSTAMLDYTRARLESQGIARKATLVAGNMESFDVGEGVAHFAFNTINTIRHLDSDEALASHFACMRRALVPAGIYAVGLSLTSYAEETETEDVWVGVRGRCRVRQVVQYLPPEANERRERVISHISVTRPTGEEHRTSTYDLRSYDAKQWRHAIANANLTIESVVDESGRDMGRVTTGYAIHVLRMPS